MVTLVFQLFLILLVFGSDAHIANFSRALAFSLTLGNGPADFLLYAFDVFCFLASLSNCFLKASFE